MKSLPDERDYVAASKREYGVMIADNSVGASTSAQAIVQPERIKSLTEVMEAISRWLNKTLSVELIAYWNPRLDKSHLVCNPLADDAQLLEKVVRQMINGAVPRIRHWRQQQWFFHLWMGSPLDSWDRLLIVETSGSLSSDELNSLIQEAIGKFHHELQTAIQEEDSKAINLN